MNGAKGRVTSKGRAAASEENVVGVPVTKDSVCVCLSCALGVGARHSTPHTSLCEQGGAGGLKISRRFQGQTRSEALCF